MVRKIAVLVALLGLFAIAPASANAVIYDVQETSGGGCTATNQSPLHYSDGRIWGKVSFSGFCSRSDMYVALAVNGGGGFYVTNAKYIAGPENTVYYSFVGDKRCGNTYASAFRIGFSGSYRRGNQIGPFC